MTSNDFTISFKHVENHEFQAKQIKIFAPRVERQPVSLCVFHSNQNAPGGGAGGADQVMSGVEDR